MNTPAVDPLERTCSEVFAEVGGEANNRLSEPVQIEVRELAEIPVFVLLGEPGMGKSETMKALAAVASDGRGQIVTVNDFIDFASSQCNAEHPVFIDALDEARAGGNTTVWSKLRAGIAQNHLTRFGIACRAADWYTTDADSLGAVANGQRVRVFALDPLNLEQRHAVLKHEDIPDIDGFEQKAEAQGFADMLGNPQSLKLLAAAIKSNGYQWPASRRDIYELACKELLRENNPHHLQALARESTHSDETMLNAAGWLYALMLLSNSNSITDETQIQRNSATVRLTEVLDALPADELTAAAIKQVLRRRLFIKPSGYTATHRTVAEYLAARYIAQRISSGGLLASRVSALMLASSQHLVSNLRGLAGWLAALSEPMRTLVFQADPSAVLNYGDLSLLSQHAKQSLIFQLENNPSARPESYRWKQAASHVSLVQTDMTAFVLNWLDSLAQTGPLSARKGMVADVLLGALTHAPADPVWEPSLLALVRQAFLGEGIRSMALHALFTHCLHSSTLVRLLNEINQGKLVDSHGRLLNSLLIRLYPEQVAPSSLLQYLAPMQHRAGIATVPMFWGYYIREKTPPSRLLDLMEAIEHAQQEGMFSRENLQLVSHGLDGLTGLIVDAIERHGQDIEVARLASWLRLCTDRETSLHRYLESDSIDRLNEWEKDHPKQIRQVMLYLVKQGRSSWDAQNRFVLSNLPPEMGAFWLEQVAQLQAMGEENKARECLETAVWWLDQEASGISLENLESAVEHNMALQTALNAQLTSTLDEKNWIRENWLQNKKYRDANLAKTELDERNRIYLLDHLGDVRNGKLLNYLSGAAWADLENCGYGGGSEGELLNLWRNQHPDLDAATRQGYRSLLTQLTPAQAASAVKNHRSGHILHIELPCLLAAHQLFTTDPEQLFSLGEERIKALIALHLLNHSSQHDWFLAVIDRHSAWAEEVWWAMSKSQLRSKTDIRIPQIGLLKYELAKTPIATQLLTSVLTAWPSKFTETNFAEFAQVLESVLKQCLPDEISRLIKERLKRKSLGTLQTGYLLMAGLWVDDTAFAPLLQSLLTKKQIVQAELLGFISHLRRYGRNSEPLPAWSASTLSLLFRVFGPLCPTERPDGPNWIGKVDEGRSFLYELVDAFRNDTTEVAQKELQQLIADPSLHEWRGRLEDAASRQAQARAEASFSVPTPRQVALTLQNKAPANPADLMAVAWDALSALQLEVKNSPTDLIDRFWTYDVKRKRSSPPHQPEEPCRNVIADWLKPRLQNLKISVQIENQHGALKRSDLALLTQAPGQPEMLLPIEVKGDWHKDLWTAGDKQLRQLYASEPRCHGYGLYLVLWTGEMPNLKQHPNNKVTTAAELQQALQRAEDERDRVNHIHVFVLDVSISA